jgi:DNA-binding CsgD family transcriptional regulator
MQTASDSNATCTTAPSNGFFQLRNLSHCLHPAVLTESGLRIAIEALATRAVFDITVGYDARHSLGPQIDAAAYYVVAESITNAMKPANASRCRVPHHRRPDRPARRCARRHPNASDAHQRGLVAADRIRSDWPTTGVLILSQHLEATYAQQLIESGVGGIGYLLKDRVLDAGQLADNSEKAGGLSSLTDRELDVLELMAQGMSDSGIAARLFVSGKTVETHVRHILTKLDLPVNTAENRRVLAVIAHLLG